MAIIHNPVRADEIIAVTGEVVRVIIVDIGPWNMDTTDLLYPLHGVAKDKILSIVGFIRTDDNTSRFTISFQPLAAVQDVQISHWNDTQIVLARKTGGLFDTPAFSSVLISRGRLTVFFED